MDTFCYIWAQSRIQLRHSSYKVTSFLDFQPFINGFQSVKNYLDNLWAHIQDPYFQYLFVPPAHMQIDPIVNNSHIERFMKSRMCVQCSYECQAKLKFEKFKWEIHYIMKIFHATYRKFLTAIDHIDYHPSKIQSNITRTKRSVLNKTGTAVNKVKSLLKSWQAFTGIHTEAASSGHWGNVRLTKIVKKTYQDGADVGLVVDKERGVFGIYMCTYHWV